MVWGISQLLNLTVGPSECAEELALIVQKQQKEKKKGTEGLRNKKLKWKQVFQPWIHFNKECFTADLSNAKTPCQTNSTTPNTTPKCRPTSSSKNSSINQYLEPMQTF